MDTLREAFAKRYPRLEKKHVIDKLARLYEQANDAPFSWETLTKPSLAGFVDRVKEEVSVNSARYYMAAFSAVLSVYEDEVRIPKGYKAILSVRPVASVSTWLTENDIDKIVKYKPADKTEEIVRNRFLLGCLTGARHSDYERFTRSNIVGDKLIYVAQKTKIKSEVPLSPAVMRILSYYKQDEKIGEVTFNNTIREICRNCGITDIVQVYHGGKDYEGEKWKFVTSHTARRSFATNVYLRCRDIFLVSRYMGHSSVDMTAKYILSIGDAPQEVREYFQQFR